MYLVSVYFDEKTDKRIRSLIEQAARASKNTYMIDEKVPPHLTISAFETRQEKMLCIRLEEAVGKIKSGTVTFASVGAFFPHVLYLAPILDEYLHQMSVQVYDSIKDTEETIISRYYKPFCWIPHGTLAKKLSAEEMRAAFEVLQHQFGMFSGKAVRIGLAKTNPYEELAVWELD